MKKPADDIEKLFQEKLGGQERQVPNGTWERIRRRIFGQSGRGKAFWWSLSIFFGGLLAFGGYWLLFPENANVSSTNTSIAQEESRTATKDENKGVSSGGPSGEDEAGSNAEKANEGAEGGKGRTGDPSEKDLTSKQKEEKEAPEKEPDPSARSSEEDRPKPSEKGSGPGGTEEREQLASNKDQAGEKQGPEERPSGNEQEKPSGEDPQNTPEKEGKAARSEDPKESEDQQKASGKKDKGVESNVKEAEGQASNASSKYAEEELDKSEDQEKSSKRADEDPKEVGGQERSDKDPEPNDKKREIALPLMQEQVPTASAVSVDSLPPMGQQPERIDISKGSQALERFYLRGYGAYGTRFRALSGGDRAAFRNEREEAVQNFAYGLESGFRWSNGLGAALGVERNVFGSDFSFSAEQTLVDSSFSTDTTTSYLDSIQDIYYDTVNNEWDTIWVVYDTTYSYDQDTSVTETDSSYSHEYAIRYRYVTVPVMLSYEFELGKGFSIVPGVGVGLNFLTRASAKWVRPESHEKVRMEHPSGDPPFRSFALSLKGRFRVRYRFADPWRVGVGFRYSRFLHSVYKDRVGLDEKPYGYGGSFSVSYLLH